MRKTYYLIEVHRGMEPFVRGPFMEEKCRDDTAKIIHRTQREDDSLFWADIDEKGGLIVGSYITNFFWEENKRITD
jgi:hypothetical protein